MRYKSNQEVTCDMILKYAKIIHNLVLLSFLSMWLIFGISLLNEHVVYMFIMGIILIIGSLISIIVFIASRYKDYKKGV